MTEANETTQPQPTSEERPAENASAQRNSEPQADPNEDRSVPYSRFTEVNRAKNAAEQRLAEMEAEQQRQEEERAKKQGEYQGLADKYKRSLDKEKAEHQATKASWQRERRLNSWMQAATGVIKPEAIIDSFDFLTEEDFANFDETDEASMRRLADSLAERKPYLADGMRGAGSGGSSIPIVSSGVGSTTAKSQGRQPLFKRGNRRPWK